MLSRKEERELNEKCNRLTKTVTHLRWENDLLNKQASIMCEITYSILREVGMDNRDILERYKNAQAEIAKSI